MGIKIIAIAPNDGWAFIEKEDKIFLLRPPYAFSNHLIQATQRDVENALHLHGFEECEFGFDDMKEVIAFLKEEYVKAMKERGIALPSLDELKELLKYASDETLLEYLEKAEKELISRGKFDAANSIALDVMKLQRENPEIHNMAIRVLEKCCQKKREMEELEASIIEENERSTWEDRFPNAAKKYSVDAMVRYKESIRDKGQILSVAA